ncbi:MAG TPA: hypothetical protein VN957_31180 [Chthoniobacterales bacterium]|jgi:hypothetical protein|nr:hypothetical protein [Chthoniobacterales bacterium]
MKTIVQFGSVALVVAFLTGALSKADTPSTFTRHGLPIPGAYFKNKESQQLGTVALRKSGKGVGEQKQTAANHKKRILTRGPDPVKQRQAVRDAS